MILKGEISEKGLLSPIHHMPFEIFLKKIRKTWYIRQKGLKI